MGILPPDVGRIIGVFAPLFFVQRWQLAVTFEEARAHLGVETQRQCSKSAIARTTPVLWDCFPWRR